MTEMCTGCTKRAYCSTLCPEAELYVKQDEVAQRELDIGLPKYGRTPWSGSNVYLTKMEKKIVTLLGQGLNRAEVAKVLGITRHSLRTHLQRLKEKSDDFDQV